MADLRLALDHLGGLSEHRRAPDLALALGAQLEEALLDLGAEVDAGGDLVGDRVRVEVEVVDVGLGGGHDPSVGGQALLDFVLVGRVRLVRNKLDLANAERAALGQADELEALVRLDDDVQAAVVKALDDLDNGAADSDVAHALLVFEHEPELVAVVEALADQLTVARLEDVQRRLLAGHEHEVERKEADLVHEPKG